MEEKKLIKKKEKAFIDNNQEQIAQCCNYLGDFYNQQGKYNDAVKEYEYEAKIYSKLGRKLDMAKAHRMVGEMFMLLSEFDCALKHINIYSKIVKELKNKVEEQRSYATLGRAHLLHGQSITDNNPSALKQLKNAEKAFIQSLLICKELTGQINKIELVDMQARLYLNIGVVKEHMEDFEESLSYMEKAIKLSKSNDIYELLHLCYISVCLLYQYKKYDSTLALRFCNLALEVAELLPNKIKKVCETLIVKSEIMIKIGDFQSAKQVLHKSYKMKTTDLNDKNNIETTLRIVVAVCNSLDSLITISSVDYKERKKLYEKLGDGCCLLLNYSKAIEFYLKMLECAELNGESNEELIPIYVSLYQTYKDNKDYEKALVYLWKEFDLNQTIPMEAFHTLCNIGEICELQGKPYWTIHEVYEKAIEQAKKTENNKIEKIGIIRLWKLQKKFKMSVLADELQKEAKIKGINVEALEGDSDTENSENPDESTPDIGDDICLDDLSDSNSEYEQTEKPRTTRSKGTCFTIKKNNKGETQLHQASISGNLALARRLIDQGHTVNVRDHAGWLPLHEACNHGYRDIAELILDNGGASAINDKGGTKCDGITPLYDACSNGYLDVVELLLDRGANATLLTDFGDNPLNILEKWRRTVDLDSCEQSQYDTIREKLVKLRNNSVSVSPKNAKSSKNNSFDNSLERLTRLAYENESDNSDSNDSNSDVTVKSLRRYTNTLKENNISSGISNTKSSAKMQYKSVMENLKHPNRLPINVCENEKYFKRRGALLGPEEVDDNNWLDNDMGPDKKRRKFTAISHSVPDRKNEKVSNSRNISRLSLPTQNTEFDINWNNSNNEQQDAFAILLDSSSKPKNSKKETRTLSTSSNSSKKSKYQSSLLENGFCRFRSDNSLTIDDSSNSPEPDSTTNSFFNSSIENHLSIYKSPAKTINSQMSKEIIINSTVSFKIKIEDELLLVPVDRKKINEINIRWLSEEASRRYYNLIGLKPILRLMTADGFAFEETDKISAAVDENMIASKVIEWQISPLSQRYEEMCQQLNQDIDQTVRDSLEIAQTSNAISFVNFCLTSAHTESIFKSILHQSNLRILDLSNNFIQNEGCKQLGKSLPTLKLLKYLNLQGNNITSDGLSYLISSNKQTFVLNELESINLSYNPLGNKSIRNLEILCKILGKLSNLYLSSCNITHFYKFDLKFNELIEFDISFNNLSNETIKDVLIKLNSCKLQYLNLNFITKNSIGTNICELLESGICEKFKRIELAGCNLIDADIYKILQNLCKSVDIEILNLFGNSRLTSISLQYILDKLPNIKKLTLDQCPQIVDICLLENLQLNSLKFPNLITLQLNDTDINSNSNDKKIEYLKQLWFRKHGERSKFYINENYICLYLNDDDLK